jgi:predicted dehydrogenase
MSSSLTPIRVGLIGYGYAGRTFHAPLIDAVPEMVLAAIASSRAGALHDERPGTRWVVDPAELLRDDVIDVVVVATPNDSHFHWTQAALEADKHVVVEKPFALDLAQARALTQLAQQRQRLLAVFHNRRWDSDYLTVKRAIEDGNIGRVVHFESHIDRFRIEVRQRWREGSGPGAGIWYDLAPHLVDQVLQLFGLPSGITACLATLRQGGLADDWAHAVLHYADKRALIHASMLVAGGSPRFIVHGENGTLVKRRPDPQEAQLLSGMRPGCSGWGLDPDPLIRWASNGAEHQEPACPGDQRAFYQALVAAVRGEAPNPTPAHQTLAVMAVLEAGVRSSRDGITAPLALSDEETAAWN